MCLRKAVGIVETALAVAARDRLGLQPEPQPLRNLPTLPLELKVLRNVSSVRSRHPAHRIGLAGHRAVAEHLEASHGERRSDHEIDVLWHGDRVGARNDRAQFAGEVEPHAGVAVEEFIDAEQRRPLELEVAERPVRHDAGQIGARVVAADNVKPRSDGANDEGVASERLHVDAGGPAPFIVAEHDRRIARARGAHDLRTPPERLAEDVAGLPRRILHGLRRLGGDDDLRTSGGKLERGRRLLGKDGRTERAHARKNNTYNRFHGFHFRIMVMPGMKCCIFSFFCAPPFPSSENDLATLKGGRCRGRRRGLRRGCRSIRAGGVPQPPDATARSPSA